MVTRKVIVTLQIEGLHNWPSCPIEEVSYLKDPHRHMFHIKATKEVEHNDRDVEIIQLKHQMQAYLKSKYYSFKLELHKLGSMSCEDIAEDLLNTFNLCECEVLEDGENGASISRDYNIRVLAPTIKMSIQELEKIYPIYPRKSNE